MTAELVMPVWRLREDVLNRDGGPSWLSTFLLGARDVDEAWLRMPGDGPDGTWLQEYRYPGRTWPEIDVPPAEPSKWLTFYAMRVLRQRDDAGDPKRA